MKSIIIQTGKVHVGFGAVIHLKNSWLFPILTNSVNFVCCYLEHLHFVDKVEDAILFLRLARSRLINTVKQMGASVALMVFVDSLG